MNSLTQKIRRTEQVIEVATGVPSENIHNKLQNKLQKNDDAGFELSYAGKVDENTILKETPSAVFDKIIDIEGTNYNSLYFGDNLYSLKSLLDDENIAGKVKLIYIDPPYAKKAAFKSRKQEHAYEDMLFGSKYIEFLRQRLIIMRELLADDGSIYVHLDETMAFPIKIIMDEIFGEKNFKNWITRKKCNPKNYTKKQYGNISDYILFYSKTKSYEFNQPFMPWENGSGEKEYSYVEEGTGRRFKKVPIHAPGIRNGETGKEWRGMLPPPGKHWQYLPEKLEKMDKNGEIFWSSTGNPRRKIYLDNSKGIPVQDIWLDFKDAHNQNIKVTGYPTEKNEDLLKRIVLASSNEGDIVLDAFAGSGTTLTVSEELGRKWIGIDSSPLAITTILNRLLNGSEKMGDFVKREAGNNEQMELIKNRILQDGLKVFVDTNKISEIPSEISSWKNLFHG